MIDDRVAYVKVSEILSWLMSCNTSQIPHKKSG